MSRFADVIDQNKFTKPEQINFDELELNYKKESFFSENKRVDNSLVKQDLSIILKYPSFKDGYRNL